MNLNSDDKRKMNGFSVIIINRSCYNKKLLIPTTEIIC